MHGLYLRGGWTGLVAAALAVLVGGGHSLIIPPPSGATGPIVSIVLLHGANISPTSYVPLMKLIQEDLQEFRVWLGLPEIPLWSTDEDISLAIKTTEEAMPHDLQYRFVAGHSLGGVRIQQYANDTTNNVTGQILYAAALQRAYNNLSYPTPTLSVGGEKDGLMRITRFAEAAYVFRSEPSKFPVVMITGANHMGFASGRPPLPVAALDLRAEVNESSAHAAIAEATAHFVRQQVTGGHAGRRGRRRDALSHATAQLLGPLIDALLVEGSQHLQRPCNSDHPSPHCTWYPAWPPQDQSDRIPSNDTACTCGCNWTQAMAQVVIGGLEGKVSYKVTDAFHDVRDTEPYHHPHLWNNCSEEEISEGLCVLNVTTVSQLIYPVLDKLETGVLPTTASEIRAKLKSRQVIYKATVDPNATLAETDHESFCAQINALAYQWALDNAPQPTRQRFEALGVPMVFDEDIRRFIGPTWINSPLVLEERRDPGTGEWRLHVQAPTMMTDVTASIYPDSDGMHYCKLLSPARAMEWLYVDSLRRHDSMHGAVEAAQEDDE